ncbi:MAG: hypothetical protein ABI789_09470, partial [Usitatibacter sp.]
MVGLLIAFPQMSLVYKSGVPDVDPSKVRLDIPGDTNTNPDDILKDLQKGSASEEKKDAPPGKKDATPEDKAAAEIEKALKGGK